MNNCSFYLFFIAVSLGFTHPIILAESVSEPCIEFSKITTFHGFVPQAIVAFIDDFNISKNDILFYKKPSSLSLLLYGEPGNGKTEVAHAIAQATDSELIKLSGATLVNSYQGSGASAIKEAIDEIIIKIQKDSSKKFILFIDEIDGIASSILSKNRVDNKLAGQALWEELTGRIPQYQKNVRCIFNTNYIDKISQQLLQRCIAVHMPIPNAKQRAIEINRLYTHKDLPSVSEGIHQIKKIFQELNYDQKNKPFWDSLLLVEKLLISLRNHIYSWDGSSRSDGWQKQYDEYVCSIEKELKVVNDLLALEPEKTLSTNLSSYKNYVNTLINSLKEYISKSKPKLTAAQSYILVQGTKTFAYRSLVSLIDTIYSNKPKDATPEQIHQIIINKLKMAQEIEKKGQTVSKSEKNELDELSKEVSLVDGLRKINSAEYDANNKSVGKTYTLSAQVNGIGGSVSWGKKSNTSKQYPEITSLIYQATQSQGNAFNKKIANYLLQYYQEEIALRAAWDNFLKQKELLPIKLFFKRYWLGKDISEKIENIIRLIEQDQSSSIRKKIRNIFLYAKQNGFDIDVRIRQAILSDIPQENIDELITRLSMEFNLSDEQRVICEVIMKGEDSVAKRIIGGAMILKFNDLGRFAIKVPFYRILFGKGSISITLVPAK